MTTISCPVEGCTKDVYRKGFCYGHYMKNWRYGTPTPDHGVRWKDLAGRRFGSLTVIRREGSNWICSCDCGKETSALSSALNCGGKISCGDSKAHHRRNSSGYSAAHMRVRGDRGPAEGYKCADCSEPAAHWSYDHADANELLDHGRSRKPVAYSLDPNHYEARCVPCHKAFDLGRKDAFDSTS